MVKCHKNRWKLWLSHQDKKNNTDDLTVSKLKQRLDEKGIKYKSSATKKELIELLEVIKLKLIKGNKVINATEKAYRVVYPGPISFTCAITIGDKDITE